jgi:H+/Cl- antiporter ClcA
LATATRAPFTGVLLTVETTGAFPLLLPMTGVHLRLPVAEHRIPPTTTTNTLLSVGSQLQILQCRRLDFLS